MDKRVNKESRRQFIRRSAMTLGLLGGGGHLLYSKRAFARVAHPHWDVTQDYPWYVDVNGGARVSLYLLGTRTIDNLFHLNLSRTVDYMLRRLNQAEHWKKEDLKEINKALNDHDPPPTNWTHKDLRKRLENAENALKRGDQQGAPYWTYLRYATTDPGAWPANVETTLDALHDLITVPVLHTHTHHNAINQFLSDHGADLRGRIGQGRSVMSLFTTASRDLKGPTSRPNVTELDLWHRARDVGLLWCAPRPRIAFDEDAFVEEDNEFDVELFEEPNGMRCNTSTGKCEAGSNDDYCQEVDGTCNGMGT